jgi:hypothetical protein
MLDRNALVKEAERVAKLEARIAWIKAELEEYKYGNSNERYQEQLIEELEELNCDLLGI